jgi:hypothetical protein
MLIIINIVVILMIVIIVYVIFLIYLFDYEIVIFINVNNFMLLNLVIIYLFSSYFVNLIYFVIHVLIYL